MRAPALRTVAVALAATLALPIAGCSRNENDGLNLGDSTAAATSSASSSETTTPSETPTPTTSANPEAARVLEQYRAFYRAVDAAEADPRTARDLQRVQRIMRTVATGRQLQVTTNRIVAGALAGEVPYGRIVLNPRVASLKKDHAVIHDCQDTSQYGVKVKGKVARHGIPEASALTELRRGEDGVWRVAKTEYVDPLNRFC